MKKFFALLLVAVLALALFSACGDKGDLQTIKDNGKIVIGVTVFKPMDWQEGDNWVGFDAEMAQEFAKYLGVDAEFMIIADWSKKALELDTKGVDVVWNGMTITEEVKSLMGVSDPYCKNAQVVVVKSDIAETVKTVDDAKKLTYSVEKGSAGAEALDALGVTYTEVDTQEKALLEVQAGAAQACVIDLLMAGAMVGEGTSMADLSITVSLTEEDYGVGFRKNSDLVAEFNKFWKEAYDKGTVNTIAEKYGISKNIIAK